MQKLIRNIRQYTGKYLSGFTEPVLINSCGRSGSSMLTKNIIQSSLQYKAEWTDKFLQSDNRFEYLLRHSISQSAFV